MSLRALAAHLMRVNGWNSGEALSFIGARREVALTSGIDKLLRSPFLYKSGDV